MNKKYLIIIMVLVSIISFNTVSFASNRQEAKVQVTSASAKINFSVPTVLPISINETGDSSTSNEFRIANGGKGPIILKDIEVNGLNGWEITNYNRDMSREKVNTKLVGISINNCDSNSNGNINFIQSRFPSITSGGDIKVNYMLNMPLQNTAYTNLDVISVTFIVDWEKI